MFFLNCSISHAVLLFICRRWCDLDGGVLFGWCVLRVDFHIPRFLLSASVLCVALLFLACCGNTSSLASLDFHTLNGLLAFDHLHFISEWMDDGG